MENTKERIINFDGARHHSDCSRISNARYYNLRQKEERIVSKKQPPLAKVVVACLINM